MTIECMFEIDCEEVVQVHMQSFSGFFLTFLGPKFLLLFYRKLIGDSSSISFLKKEQGQISGFVVGSTHPSRLYSRLLRESWWQFGWSALSSFVKKPSILPRLLRAFSKPVQKQPFENCGELMSIAVLPEAQGKGFGKQLIQAFLEESRNQNLDHVRLTTDAENNDVVNHFYKKMGFVINCTYVTRENRVMNEYLIHL